MSDRLAGVAHRPGQPAPGLEPDRAGELAATSGEQAEANLLARAQSGDRDALEQLCREHWLRVYRAVSRRAGTLAEAEDLTQEVFVRAIRGLSRHPDPRVPFRGYLLRIARNLVIDGWRKRTPRPASDFGPGDPADLAAGPEATAIARDERRRLLAALDRLPDSYSDVLRLRVLEERTAAEVGVLLGQTANAVRQLQYRALAALRRELTTEAGEDR